MPNNKEPYTMDDVVRMLELTLDVAEKVKNQQQPNEVPLAEQTEEQAWRKDNPLRPERRRVDNGFRARVDFNGDLRKRASGAKKKPQQG